MKRFAYLLLLVSLSASCRSIKGQELDFVRNRTTCYKIVIPKEASVQEVYSASELQKYIQLVSDTKLEIIKDNLPARDEEICIGKTNRFPLTKLKPDELVIRSDNKKLILDGGENKGILYSTYTFLNKYLGCVKYSNDSVQYQAKSNISLSIVDEVAAPSFINRTLYTEQGLNKEYCDWNRINYFFEDWGDFAHTFDKLVSKDLYFKDHPEYFSLIDGVRKPEQLCLSNRDVLKIAIDKLREMFINSPGIKYVSVSQNDNEFYCQCPDCLKKYETGVGYQGALLPFVNAIAKEFPDKGISTLAYLQSLEAPKGIYPEKNVMIVICATEVNRAGPLVSDTDGYSVRFKNALTEWSKRTNNTMVWDYVVQYNHFIYPFPNLGTLKPNLIYFRNLGVDRILEQGAGNIKSDFSELKSYMLAKLMWDVNADADQLMTEFVYAYYGKSGGKYVLQYIETLNNDFNKRKLRLGIFDESDPALNTYLNDTNLALYKSYFSKAKASTRNAEFLKRIKKDELSVDYAIILSLMKDKQRNRVRLSLALEKFKQTCKVLGVKQLNENGMEVDLFYKTMLSPLGN